MKYITFKNQDKMPMLGLGTWKSGPGEVYQAVLWALEAGYRHIDCAAIYQNEKEVGDALNKAFKDGIVSREEVWVTSKLWNNAHEMDKVEGGLQKSLADLQLDYLDLYLIHWPISLKEEVMFPKSGDDFLDYKTVPLSDTWKGMEALKDKGLVKHIGVSNFNISKLKEILDSCVIAPEMNQIELHPYLPQDGLVGFCKENGINITAYSPLGSADRPKARQKDDDPILMEHKVFKDIAQKHGVSVAQVLIAWSLHRDIAVIPKSANKERIKANLESKDVELQADDLKSIADINSHHRYIDGTFFTEVPGSPFRQSDLWED
ncbi:aldo/keto reductase [Cyclobacterium qasimii]|uniref:Oxidoreductase of aldo/keto reductase family, subgroup 1 n=2 Tax=Cyclobacterium qasimii TaxID=1350429 RepID=S7VQ06_9BACT|nr:aldo/keto reductase [Cyclobacterium qasimii]EPR71442.1 oxidoreductase of aldo/keto reductase family, subgroup 1 [Cyclobacterium qasimii M12-11B]GEO23630.1 aldehyde reductase [Cyclobacterium qasimii]